MLKFNTHFYRIKDLSILFSIFLISFYTNANSDLDKLNVPNGFEISIFADKLGLQLQGVLKLVIIVLLLGKLGLHLI